MHADSVTLADLRRLVVFLARLSLHQPVNTVLPLQSLVSHWGWCGELAQFLACATVPPFAQDELGIEMEDDELEAMLEKVRTIHRSQSSCIGRKAGADAAGRLGMDAFYNVMRHEMPT